LEQLLAAGLTQNMVKYAIRSGRLHPRFRGVYAVGHTALSRQGWWTAALLACGPGSALAFGSAATAWGFHHREILPVEVIVPGARGRKQRNVNVHRMPLGAQDTVILDGLRVTTPARTIVDLAAKTTPRQLRHIVERAQDLRRFHPDVIRSRAAGRRGCKELRDLLAMLEPDKDKARSHLERLFLAVIRRHRLPRPDVNARIARRRRDFVWPASRLVVEVDGYRWHSTKAAKRRDHRRDRELTALGWRPVRLTFEDIAFEPDELATELTDLLGVAAPAPPRRRAAPGRARARAARPATAS
jgi:very-short-patch-repair endonuclease